MLVIANLPRYTCAKNYQNRVWFDKVIAKIKRCFDSHGRQRPDGRGNPQAAPLTPRFRLAGGTASGLEELSLIWISDYSLASQYHDDGRITLQKELLLLVHIQVLVLDLSGPTLLQFGLGTFFGPTRSMCSICSVVFVI